MIQRRVPAICPVGLLWSPSTGSWEILQPSPFGLSSKLRYRLMGNEAAAAFVKRLTAYPYLFFLAEKEGETLKFLTALSCRKGGLVGDNLSLDKDLFNELLQKQMKGILVMSQAAHFSPENAKSIMDSVFTYFGMDN